MCLNFKIPMVEINTIAIIVLLESLRTLIKNAKASLVIAEKGSWRRVKLAS